MKVLLEGSLNDSLTMRDLLTGILHAEAPGLSLLKLANVKNEENGEIYFLGGRYIVGAKSLDKVPVSGLGALDCLLHLRESAFVYYACESLHSLPQSQDLKTDLKELIENWQGAKPIAEEDLLDRIFNTGAPVKTVDPGLPPSPPNFPANQSAQTGGSVTIEEKSQSTSAPLPIHGQFTQGKKQSAFDWDFVEPIAAGGPDSQASTQIGWQTGSNQQSLKSFHFETENTESTNKVNEISNTQGLRSLSSSSGIGWQHQLRNLATILALLLTGAIVIFFTARLLVNTSSSHLAPQRSPEFDSNKDYTFKKSKARY